MSDTVASVLRGLAQADLAKFGVENPAGGNDPYAAAYPNFQRYIPPGGTDYRDDAVLLCRSIATRSSRPLGSGPSELSAWNEDDIPAVFRALNPVNDTSDRGFPTFTYFLGPGDRRYMRIVRIKAGSFNIQVFPDALVHDDPTAVVAMFVVAHYFARQKGFKTGFPTFNRIPIPGTSVPGNEVVVFPMYSSSVWLSSEFGVDTPQAWTFAKVPVINEGGPLGGLALASTGSHHPLFFDVFDGQLSQYRHTPPNSMLDPIDPLVTGEAHAPGPIQSQVSALADTDTVHVLYSDRALFHVQRPDGLPDSFTFKTFPGGPWLPSPEFSLGDYNHLTVDPYVGDLHLFAHRKIGAPRHPGDLVHISFNGTSWSDSDHVVDGSAKILEETTANVGRGIATAWETSTAGTLHAFYVLTTDEGHRLRHAELGPEGWTNETLDGSGGSAPPGKPGAGPTRASVGTSPTAAFFDDSIWCIYNDETWGNLRVARGKRYESLSPLERGIRWEFHVLDGGFRGDTRNTVQSPVAVVWGVGGSETLSVFYIDEDEQVLRHAFRHTGATGWRYEVVDGDGGLDGRVDAPIRAPVAAVVAVDRTRLHVGYLWESEDTPRWSNVRLATYVVSTMPVPTVPNVLSISTTEIAFGEIKVGTDSVFVPVTLTNHGAVPFGPLMGFGGAPATAEFSSYQSCEGETLGPRGGSCNFYFKFSPSGPGEFNDVSNVVYSETSYAEGQRFTVALTGIGVP